MRLRKILVTVLFGLNLILETVYLGLAIAEQDTVATHVVRVVFPLYAVVVAGRSVQHSNISYHNESITHLTVLSVVATTVLGVASLLPSVPPPTTLADAADSFVWLRLAVIAVYALAGFVSATTPTGPFLHFDHKDIYLPKEVSAATNHDYANVTGVTGQSFFEFMYILQAYYDNLGSSPWDTLFFSYTTKVVMLGNIAESLEIADLPVVPASMRSIPNYTQMTKTLRTVTLKIRSWSPKVGSGWNLGYKLIHLNRVGLFAQMLLASSSASLYYVPPFFLNRLIAYLEADPDRKTPAWGWVYAVGLFGTSAFQYLRKSPYFERTVSK